MLLKHYLEKTRKEICDSYDSHNMMGLISSLSVIKRDLCFSEDIQNHTYTFHMNCHQQQDVATGTSSWNGTLFTFNFPDTM